MKTIAFLLFVLIISNWPELKAQANLIPNGSFEEIDSCGFGYRGIDNLCKHWFTPMAHLDTAFNPFEPNNYGSSDYFNPCNHNDFQTPNNTWGYQVPQHDSSYAGFGLISVIHPPGYPYHNYKEYIEIKLATKLVAEHKYCLEYYYSVTDYWNYQDINIQALITKDLVKRTPSYLYWFEDIIATPQVSQALPSISDTVNWHQVNGSFIASGEEEYLTIGNFDYTDNIYKSVVYVFVDNVKLSYCGPDTVPSSAINVYPNPVITEFYFEFNNISFEDSHFILYDALGRKVFDKTNIKPVANKAIIDLSLLSAGTYIYHIRAGNGMWKKGKLIKI